MTSNTEDRSKLDGLLGFAAGVIEARSPVQMTMSGGLGLFLEDSIQDLPGLHIDAEDVWLRIDRLQPTKPPEPADYITEFLSGKGNDPVKKPTLREAISKTVSNEEASDLAEAGLLRDENCRPDDEDGIESTSRSLIILLADDLEEMRQDFEAYLAGPWSDWAAAERPIRQSIKLYNDLFKIHSAIHAPDGTPPELVWGIGVARWKHESGTVDMPLIEQQLDIQVEDGGGIALFPRQIPPVLSLKPYLSLDITGANTLQTSLQDDFARILQGADDFTPFTTSWEPLLTTAAAQLSPRGTHMDRTEIAEGARLAAPSEELRITSHWAIFGRPRSGEARAQDIEALRQQVKDEGRELPDSIKGYAAPAPDEERPDISDYGLSSTLLTSAPSFDTWSEGHGGSSADAESNADTTEETDPNKVKFFPLPANQEQARIIDLLDDHNVVSVTGPPGCGKTHTIANIVSHYMATGKRVLVTARTAEAIAAVREKLPESLRPLVIASVGTDRESTKQLQDAITKLSDEAVGLNKSEVRQQIALLEAGIVECNKIARDADRLMAQIARANIAPLKWRGEDQTPMAVAEMLDADAELHDWFTDRPESEPTTDLGDVLARLKSELPVLAPDMVYAGLLLPENEHIPQTVALIAAHKTQAAHATRVVPDYSNAPEMARDTPNADNQARSLLHQLLECRAIVEELGKPARKAYTIALADPIQGGLTQHSLRAAKTFLEGYRQYDRARDVSFNLGPVSLDDFTAAAKRGAAGQKPVGFGLFKSDLKAAVASARVDDQEPSGAEDWGRVHTACRLSQARSDLIDGLAPLVEAGALASVPAMPAEMMDYITHSEGQISRVLTLEEAMRSALDSARQLFPYGVDLDALYQDLSFDDVIFALQANIPDDHQQPPEIGILEEIGQTGTTPIHKTIAELAASLGTEKIDEPKILGARKQITVELARIAQLAPRLSEMQDDLSALSQAGATEWRARLEDSPLETETLIPDTWREAWAWAIMRARVDRIVTLGNGDDARRRKDDAVKRRERKLEDLIRQRTMLGLNARMTDSVHRAMMAFTEAITRLGKGTGKNAPRFRREAQQAAKDASTAAPVWVMPEFKIPESLPPQLADFDLVILDEASQSDITALAALARGKKLLVVGDEAQVSPQNVGTKSEKISALRAEFLQGLPNPDLYDENASIFGTTVRMFPRSHTILREHFRCVAPIIQYSTRFYSGRLIPLRIPRASERFDPPLVDVYIRGGNRTGRTNRHEAEFIVEEIARLVQDETHAHRNFGVISLIGKEQAELIERMLIDHPKVGTEIIQERQIILGDARTMQGQERSIVFLSMVASPDHATAQTAKDVEQRFNVAMSRAADRLYLVRSVDLSHLKEADLKAGVIKHFAEPMPEGRVDVPDDLLDRCDSGFEREVLTMLLEAGYRAKPQVKAGAYSIDIVVEGRDDHRLAIELDGDRYHGPDVWDQDMARQAALERAGWTFWRVFGSQWNVQKNYWWQDLQATLQRLRIEPIGQEQMDERFTDFLTIDAFDLDPMEDQVPVDLDDPTPEVNPAERETDKERDPAPETTPEKQVPAAPTSDPPANEVSGHAPAQGSLNFDTLALHNDSQGHPPETADGPKDKAAGPTLRVEVGCTVTVQKNYDDRGKMRVVLVQGRGNLDAGELGTDAPLGKSLLDAEIGDTVSFSAGVYLREVEVLEIEDKSP